MATTSILTYSGEQWAAERMAGIASSDGSWVGWGTGAGIAAKTDTDLFIPASEARVMGTVSVQGTGAIAKYQVVATLTADAAKTITNVGTFTGSIAGNIVVHGSFDGIPLNEDDQITFTITVDPS